MSIETDFFKRSRPDFPSLEACGFNRKNKVYEYRENFLKDQFCAELQITEGGTIRGKVIDLETGEEYLPIRVQNQVGEFVGTVREAYLELLGKLEDACFVPVHFVYDQANRMETWIYGQYGARVEFPWEKYPGNGTFKCNSNDKWFAALLTVERGKLTGTDEDEIVEVMNLKADPDEIPELTKKPGVFRAWHMNKKHWISVLLDDTLDDEAVMALIRSSFQLVAKGKGKKVSATGAWVIPSNPKIYNVDAGFRAGKGVIEWHQHNDIKAGDEVYIYSSAPNSAILYRCEAVETDLVYRGMFKDSKGYKRSMRIRLIEKYPPDKYPLTFIKAHGGSVVRSARSMPKELLEAIKNN